MSNPPEFYQQARSRYPELFAAYEQLAQAARSAGPLDERTAALIKLALSIAAGLEGAAHSAARKARHAGCSAAELEHVCLLATTTIGFPAMMRARAWVADTA